MVKKCVVCGNEFDEAEMIPFFTGRMKWKCWKCEKEAGFQYHGYSSSTSMRIAREVANGKHRK